MDKSEIYLTIAEIFAKYYYNGEVKRVRESATNANFLDEVTDFAHGLANPEISAVQKLRERLKQPIEDGNT